jgi:hypothetical protein
MLFYKLNLVIDLLYYEYCSCVELLIVILVKMLKIFTLLNKKCGYGEPTGTHLPTRVWVWDDFLPVGGYGARYGY